MTAVRNILKSDAKKNIIENFFFVRGLVQFFYIYLYYKFFSSLEQVGPSGLRRENLKKSLTKLAFILGFFSRSEFRMGFNDPKL